jgi:hypothetical protein
MNDEVEKLPVEEVEVEKEVPEHVRQAMELGWKPKDQFEGDPEDFRSAKDFIERGEMIGKIRSTTQQLKKVEDALRHIANQNKAVYANGYDQALKDLKAERREALADGDLVKADDLQERIEETKELKVKAIQEAGRPVQEMAQSNPAHEAWLARNPWYENKVMRKFADALAIEFIHENKGRISEDDVRKYVADTVREQFPQHFDKKVVAAPSPDSEGRGTTRSPVGSDTASKVKAGMSEEERTIMKTLIRATGMTEKEYLKQYSEAR